MFHVSTTFYYFFPQVSESHCIMFDKLCDKTVLMYVSFGVIQFRGF